MQLEWIFQTVAGSKEATLSGWVILNLEICRIFLVSFSDSVRNPPLDLNSEIIAQKLIQEKYYFGN